MTPAERRAQQRLLRAAGQVTPELEAALVQAFARLRQMIGAQAFARAIADGTVERLIVQTFGDPQLWEAFGPVRERLRVAVEQAARTTYRAVPRPRDATLGVAFDTLAPQVVEAVRTLQTEVITRLGADVREVFRQHIRAGLEAGLNPRQVATGLRNVLELTPRQEQAIRNYRAALESGTRRGLSYGLRDRRYDAAVKRGDLSPERIDRMVDAYRRKFVAYNAETQARTAALESQRLGQQLAWREAQAAGAFGDANVVRVWVATLDNRVRDEHAAMHHAEAPLDGTYANGDAYPGQSSPWNCRCTEIIRVRR